MDLKILYEDSHIIVVVKPPKVPSQSDKTGDMDLLSLIVEHIKKQHDGINNPYVGLIHRLDRPVGGVMVYAKTKYASSQLSKQVQDKQIKKTYYAVVCGEPENNKGELVNYLKRLKTINMSKVVEEKDKDAKKAILEYECIQTINTAEHGTLSLMKINLITGRHHQIRVQMSHFGLPLWGDNKYNKDFMKSKKWTQIGLWSGILILNHPKTKKEMVFKALPDEVSPFNLFQISNYILLTSDQ